MLAPNLRIRPDYAWKLLTAYAFRMRLLDSLTDLFIQAFPITKPSEQMRKRVGWFLLVVLSVVAVGLCGLGILLYHLINA
jgi:hypothetical protein